MCLLVRDLPRLCRPGLRGSDVGHGADESDLLDSSDHCQVNLISALEVILDQTFGARPFPAAIGAGGVRPPRPYGRDFAPKGGKKARSDCRSLGACFVSCCHFNPPNAVPRRQTETLVRLIETRSQLNSLVGQGGGIFQKNYKGISKDKLHRLSFLVSGLFRIRG